MLTLTLIYIIFFIMYLILLGLSIWRLTDEAVCDFNTCKSFVNAFTKDNTKDIALHLLDHLCEESLWPFAFIASSIIMFLLMTVLPIEICFRYFIIVFLFSFIVFYCIISFLVFHYVKPIKQYIIDYINKEF